MRSSLAVTANNHGRRNELDPSEPPRDVAIRILIEHAPFFTLRATVITCGIRSAAAQVPGAACLIGRVAAPVEWRILALGCSIDRFLPLRARCRECPRASFLNANVRQKHALQI